MSGMLTKTETRNGLPPPPSSSLLLPPSPPPSPPLSSSFSFFLSFFFASFLCLLLVGWLLAEAFCCMLPQAMRSPLQHLHREASRQGAHLPRISSVRNKLVRVHQKK